MLKNVFILYSRHSKDSLMLVDRIRGDPNLNFVSTIRVDSDNIRKYLDKVGVITVPTVCVGYTDNLKFFQGKSALTWIDETSTTIEQERKIAQHQKMKNTVVDTMDTMDTTDTKDTVAPRNTRKQRSKTENNNIIEPSDTYSIEKNSAIKPDKKQTASIMQLAKEMESGRGGKKPDNRPTGAELQEKINGSGFDDRGERESDTMDLDNDYSLASSSSITGDQNTFDGTTDVMELI